MVVVVPVGPPVVVEYDVVDVDGILHCSPYHPVSHTK